MKIMHTEFSGETHMANEHLNRHSTSNNGHHLHLNRLASTRKANDTCVLGGVANMCERCPPHAFLNFI